MSQYTKAAEDIKSIAGKLRGFLEIADALEKIGNVEHASEQAKLVEARAVKDAEKAKEQAQAAGATLDSALSDVEMAKKLAVELQEKAQAKYSELLDEVKAKVLQAEADIESQKLQAKHAYADAAKELYEINGQIIARKNELSDIKSQIAMIKQKIHSVVGN